MSIADYNRIFSKPSNKQMRLEFEDGTVITNEQICSEEMSIEEALCSDEYLRFGACEATCFKIRVVNSGSFEGQKVVVSQTLKGKNGHIITSSGDNLVDSDGNYISYADYSSQDSLTIPYGTYKVVSDKPSNDRMWRNLECYDSMYDIINADVSEWYKNLTFPMTLKNLRDSFFNEVGVTQETITLPNDSMNVLGGFTTEGVLSGKTIIEAICEINGVFGHINRNDVFEYIGLPSQEIIGYEWYIADTGTYEDYVTENITRIVARGEGEDSVPDTVGVEGNDLIIDNNPLLYGLEGTSEITQILTNLLNVVSSFSYRPFRVETYGNPMLPVGTCIQINTKKYDPQIGYSPLAINSLVMKRTLVGIQALKDTIEAVGERIRPANVNSMQSELTRTRGRVHTLVNNVNELTSEIYEVDPQTGTKSSRIEQTLEQIVLKVDNNGEMVEVELGTDPDDSSATAFNVKATNINFSAFNLNMETTNFKLNSNDLTLDKDGLVVKGSYWNSTVKADTFKINSTLSGNPECVMLGVGAGPTSLQNSGGGMMHLKATSGNLNSLAMYNGFTVANGTLNALNTQQTEIDSNGISIGKHNTNQTGIGNQKILISGNGSNGMIYAAGSSADVRIVDALESITSTISLRTANTNASNAITKIGTLGVQAMDSSPGAIAFADSTWKSAAALNNLPAGKYLLIGTVGFASNSTGGRYAVISTTNASGSEINFHARTASGAYGATRIHVITQVNITSAATYHLNAYQNSGGSLNVTGRLTAIRIGA